jgi:hypothetical protein
MRIEGKEQIALSIVGTVTTPEVINFVQLIRKKVLLFLDNLDSRYRETKEKSLKVTQDIRFISPESFSLDCPICSIGHVALETSPCVDLI